MTPFALSLSKDFFDGAQVERVSRHVTAARQR